VQEDVAYQLKAGYAEVISCNDLQKLRPKQLNISPLAVVPQRNRRGRMILDLSFRYSRSTDQPEENKTGTDQKGTQACGHGCRAVSPQGYNDD
jgi:hypothetical protein